MEENIKHQNLIEKIILLDDKQKEEVAIKVTQEGKLTKLYWLQLFLAGVIATLGLLQNSIPVVIGVMLIAPLMRPIESLSFGIITAHQNRSWIAFKNIFWSVVLVSFSAYLITLLIPVRLESSEILARTNPNILDFFIASFSAAIGFLALVYKEKLSMSIAGVSMAASLLPPLSVIGIEIAYSNYFLAWGSFLLFLTNLVAIVFVGIFLFFIFGFRPHQEDDKEQFRKNILILLLSLSIISLPLLVSILNLKENFQKEIFLRDEIKKEIQLSDFRIKNIEIKKDKKEKTNILLSAEYYDEKKLDFVKEKIKEIKSRLEKEYGKVDLKLKLELVKSIEI